MCANYRRTKAVADIYAEFSATRLPVLLPERHAAPNLELQYEVRPTNSGVILRQHSNGVELTRMRWELVP